MSDLKQIMKSGEPPRLIPVVSDTSKEQRALSILLSMMLSVEEFRAGMLASLGVRVGKRSKLEAFTECVFDAKNVGKDRPDGLLALSTGKKQWSALVEAKIGNAELDGQQVERYAECAKTLGINAVLTVSNQFVALPQHHPVRLSKTLSRHVDLFHWSWMFVITQANLVLSKDGIGSPDQRYLLEEALRFWQHDSAGISTFDRMNRDWKDLVGKVRHRTALKRNAPEVENSVASWHQEERDLCLLLSRRLGRTVDLRMPRAHRKDPVQRLQDDCADLVKTGMLECEFDVPGAAAPLHITVDLAARTIRCSMQLQAPTEKKRASARVNWLVRQLAKTEAEGIHIKALRRGRAEETEQPLALLREDASQIESTNTNVPPGQFEIFMVEELGGRFAGNKNFVDHIEAFVPEFYQRVGQHLRAWVPPPPKLSKRDPGKSEEREEERVAPAVPQGESVRAVVPEGSLE